MSRQLTLWDTPSATSSLASADGHTPSGSPAGPTTGPCGRAHARASRSARPAGAKVQRMPATSRLFGYGSSPSAVLANYLANNLMRALRVDGSILYSMNWKDCITPAGRWFSLLAASGRRICVSGSTLLPWPTPTVGDSSNSANSTATRHVLPPTVVHAGLTLVDATRTILLPWATPRARDHKGNGVSRARAAMGVNDSLDLQAKSVEFHGKVPSIFGARMARDLPPLNHRFSLWLMGFPAEWAYCGERAMQSCHGNRKPSSKPTSKR